LNLLFPNGFIVTFALALQGIYKSTRDLIGSKQEACAVEGTGKPAETAKAIHRRTQINFLICFPAVFVMQTRLPDYAF